MGRKNPNIPQIKIGDRERPVDILADDEKETIVNSLNCGNMRAEVNGRILSLNKGGAIGNTDSAHDVFFAGTNDADKKKRSSFACKRFRRGDKAERELSAMHEAALRGFNTLQPAGSGIYDVAGVGSVLVTNKLPRVATMNQLGWADSFPGQREYNGKVAKPLQRIARFVGGMHKNGVYHGDLQLKNIAVDAKDQFLLFDLEDAEFYDESSDEFIVTGKFADDIEKMIYSMVDRGFLWDMRDDVFIEEVTSKVIEPYLEVNDTVSLTIIDKIDLILKDTLVRRAEVRSRFSKDWDAHYAA